MHPSLRTSTESYSHWIQLRLLNWPGTVLKLSRFSYQKPSPKWHQNDTKMTLKLHQNNTKMIPKWHSNDIKMTSKCIKFKWLMIDQNDTNMTLKMTPKCIKFKWMIDQNDTKMTKITPKLHLNYIKMTPKWHQNDMKMTKILIWRMNRLNLIFEVFGKMTSKWH